MQPTNRVEILLKLRDLEMPRAPEGKVQFATYLSEELKEDVSEFSKLSGISITRITEDALRAYLTTKYFLGHRDEDVHPEGLE
jgi:hypothetical protein